MEKEKDKRFFLALNYDAAQEFLQPGDFIDSLNIRCIVTDQAKDGILENTRGNTSKFTELGFSLPTGTNICVGDCMDEQNNRLIWLNYNSNANHGVYCYNYDSNSIETIMVTPALNFQANIVISSTDIINNILIWTDNYNPQRKVYVNSALQGQYGTTIVPEMINDAKVCPSWPLKCTPIETAGFNNIQSLKSFQFIYRYVYFGGEKSVWSTVSKLVPTGYVNDRILTITLDFTACELFTNPPLQNVITYVEFASRELYTLNFNQFARLTTAQVINGYNVTNPTTNALIPGQLNYFDTEAKTPVDTAETDIAWSEVPLLSGSVCFQDSIEFSADTLEGYNFFPAPISNVSQFELPASGGLPDVSDCDLHINQRYYLPGGCAYGLSGTWYDEYGRKNGAIDLPQLAFTTAPFRGNFAKANGLQFDLNLADPANYPPWAVKFEVLRTANKSVVSFFEARANNVFYYTGQIDPTTGDYIYVLAEPGPGNSNLTDAGTAELHVDISNLLQYGTNIPYVFTPGDKITFITTGGNQSTSSNQNTSPRIIELAAAPSLTGLNILGTIGSLVRVDYSQAYNYNFNAIANDPGKGDQINDNPQYGMLVVGNNGIIAVGFYGFGPSGNPPPFQSNLNIILPTLTTANLYACDRSRGFGSGYYQGGSANLDLIGGDNGQVWAMQTRSDANQTNDPSVLINPIAIVTGKTGAIRGIGYNNDYFISTSTNSFWVCGDGGTILRIYSNVASDWTPANLLKTDYSQPAYGNINSIASSFNTYEYAVMCGDNGLLAYTQPESSTNLQWTAITCNRLNSICICKGSAGVAYIAVGDSGTILYNTLGLLVPGGWQILPTTTAANLYSIKQNTQYEHDSYHTGYIGRFTQFTIVGEDGTCFILDFSGSSPTIYDNSNVINITEGDAKASIIQCIDPWITTNIPYAICVGTKDTFFDLRNLISLSTPEFQNLNTNITGQNTEYILNWGAKFEIYTPTTSPGAEDIYYEYGDAYAVGQNYTINAGKNDDGDAFLIKKNFQGSVPLSGSTTNTIGWSVKGDVIFSMQPNSNNTTGEGVSTPNTTTGGAITDTPTPWDLDWGRPNIVELYPEVQERRNIIRFSNPYIQDSKVNGLSYYLEESYVIIPYENGLITKITPVEFVMLINCTRHVVTAYINKTIFNQSSTSPGIAATSDTVINNVTQLKGAYGCSNPESITKYDNQVYFYSANKGVVVRYNFANGCFKISDYAARNYFYNKNDENLAYCNLHGGFDPRFRSFMLTFNYQFSFTQETVVDIEVGLEPSGTLFAPNNGYLFSINNGASSITPINTATNAPSPDIPIGGTLSGGVFAPSDNCLYLPNTGGSGYVQVVDTVGLDIVDTITGVGTQPNGAIYYNSKVYITNVQGGTIATIDVNPSSGTYRQVIHTSSFMGDYLVAPNLNPDNGEIYYSATTFAELSVLSTSTNDLLITISLPSGSNPHGSIYAPNVKRLYVCLPGATGTNQIAIIDTNPANGTYHTVLGYITLPANGVISGIYLNNFVWLAGGTGSFLYGIDTTQGLGKLVIIQPVGNDPQLLTVDPNNNYLFLTTAGDTVVTVYDTINQAVLNNINVGFQSEGITFVPSNGKIYATVTGSNLVVSLGGMITPDTIAFNEDGNRWTSRFSFIPERYGWIKNTMYTFLNGELWEHNSSQPGALYNNFYGQQYGASVTVVFNMEPSVQKNYENILAETMYNNWVVSSISTQEGQEAVVPGTPLNLQTINKVQDVTIFRDINTPNLADPQDNGSFIQSNTLTVVFQNNGTTYATFRFANVFSKRAERTDK